MGKEQQLTGRQAEVLAFIAKKQRRAGPTLGEVAEHFEFSKNAAHGFVKYLRDAGRLEPESGDGLVVVPLPTVEIKFVGVNSAESDQSTKERELYLKRMGRAPVLKPKGRIS